MRIAKVLLASLLVLILPSAILAAPDPVSDRATVIVIVGAAGLPQFTNDFAQQADLWEKVCTQADCRRVTIGVGAAGATNDCEQLKQILAAEPKEGLGQLWLVLIGHGTFDGKEARFNLRGPDVSATELSDWLKPFVRPLAVINTTASSAPFLVKLSGTNRVVMSATRSGSEQNYARFGNCFAKAISDPTADFDKDGRVSLLEAFLMGSRQANEFYKVEGRIATEHALLDDNGDGLGTPADWFRGLRATKKARENAALDGLIAGQFHLLPDEAEKKLTPEQRAQYVALERAVLLHREKKSSLPEEEYFRELEKLLLALGRFYESNAVDRVTPPTRK